METEILRQLASTGVVGILLVLTLFQLRNERNELRALTKTKDEELRALTKAKDEEMRALIKSKDDEMRALIKSKDDAVAFYQKRLEDEMRARIEDQKAKDARLEEEMSERIEDAKRFNTLAMTMQESMIRGIEQLSRITHEIAGLGEMIRDWHKDEEHDTLRPRKDRG